MNAVWLCLCSQTKLVCVPSGQGNHTLWPSGLYAPSKYKYYAGGRKTYSGVERALKKMHPLGADVDVVIFFSRSLTFSVCFSKIGTKVRSAYALMV